MLLHDILNNKFDCPQLINNIHFNVPLRRTRHTTLFAVPSASTNYLKMSPFLRLPALYNDKFSVLDLFGHGTILKKRSSLYYTKRETLSDINSAS